MNEMTNKRKHAGFGRMGIIVTVIIVVAGLAAFIMFRGEKKEAIKIGAILPFTGVGESTAIEARDGMLLAADWINSRNGINGRKIELIFGDSKTNPQEGKRVFNRIEKAHHPLFYVSALSAVSMAIAPLSEENRVALVGIMTATTGFTEGGKWVFRYYHTAELDAQPTLSILQKLKVKNLGIIYLNDEYGESVFKIAREAFQESGGTIRSEPFETREVNYKERIVKLKDMEAIYFIGFAHHIQKAFKQLRGVDFKGFIIVSTSGSDPFVTSMPEANGAYVSAPIIYNPDYLFAKEAKEKYEAKCNKPFNMFAATGYDALMLIAGLLKDKEVSRENLRVMLEEGFMYPGVFGVLDVKPGEHEIPFPLYPGRIVDGELKYLIINK
ncbi:MAG TPA: ABC transporter substrate-binding protein [Desulfatiglandales bacterium]|nr:ABC transporter substrate-binding protein [Desulfatiglandales bacterium]